MEERQLSMKWYNAYKVIMLVLGIWSALGVAGMAVIGAIYAVCSIFGDAELQMISSTIFTASMELALIKLISMIIFFMSFYSLKKYKSRTIGLMYVQNVWFPLSCILSIPVLSSYISKLMMFDGMQVETFEDLQYMVMVNDIIKTSVIVIGIFCAAVVCGLLVPNTIYFKKRRCMLGHGEPIMRSANYNNQNMYSNVYGSNINQNAVPYQYPTADSADMPENIQNPADSAADINADNNTAADNTENIENNEI